jgi:hypothetical protein
MSTGRNVIPATYARTYTVKKINSKFNVKDGGTKQDTVMLGPGTFRLDRSTINKGLEIQ